MSGFDTLKALGVDVRKEAQVILPSGGEFTGGGGIIAPVTARVLHWFMTDQDYVQYNVAAENADGSVIAVPDVRNFRSEYYHMYYASYASALEAYHALDSVAAENDYKPQEYWVFTAPVDSVLNRTADGLEKMREGFGEQIMFQSRIMKLARGSQKYPVWDRHQYNLLTLPSMVAALAQASGNDAAVFDLEDVLSVREKDDCNDEAFFALFGHPEGEYEDSVYFTRRAALWAVLGEKDPKKDQCIGAKTAKGKTAPRATTSEALNSCLGIVQYPWGAPIWMRLHGAINPAAHNAKQPKYLPVVTEIFLTEDEARAAAAEEMEERGEEVTSASVPSGWRETGEVEWLDYVKKNDDLDVTVTSPPPEQAKLIKILYADNFDQIVAAREKNG